MSFVEIIFVVIIPMALFTIMLGMGLSLTMDDLKRVVVFPRAVLLGLCGQLLLLPLLAFALIALIGPSPAIAVGTVILAACPGGTTSNGFVFACRADIALSVTLTAITSVVTVFTIPFLTHLALNVYFDAATVPDVPVGTMMIRLATLTLLPLALGMTFRANFPARTDKLLGPMRKVTIGALFFVIGTVCVTSMEDIIANIPQAGVMAFALNISSMLMGYALASGAQLPSAQAISITFEVGLQNLSLALLVAVTILGRPELGATALVYFIAMNITAIGLTYYAIKLLRQNEAVG
mgnify:CR=1 FL=1